jgi:hypothetical protein
MDDAKVTAGGKRLVGPYDYGGWEVRTVGGLVLRIAADGVGLESDPRNFSFRVADQGREWDEPVLFVRSKDLTSARVLSAPH